MRQMDQRPQDFLTSIERSGITEAIATAGLNHHAEGPAWSADDPWQCCRCPSPVDRVVRGLAASGRVRSPRWLLGTAPKRPRSIGPSESSVRSWGSGGFIWSSPASETQPRGGSVSSTALHRIRQGPLTGSLLRRARQSSNRAPWPAPPAPEKW